MASPSPPPSRDGGLRRDVSAGLLLVLLIGDILGAGIYILVGEVAGEIGSSAWLAFALAFAIAGLSASSYSELVTRFPGSAGAALYVGKAFGIETLTFAVGMAVMLSSVSTAATTARAFAGDYLDVFVDAPVILVSVALVAALTMLSLRGIAVSARVNVGMTIIEVGGLVVVVVIGLAAIADGGGDPGRVTDFSDVEVDGLLTATALAFFAFLGFEDAVHLSEEVEETRDTFPRVMFGAVVIATALYLAVVLVATMAVDAPDLAASDGPLLEVAGRGPLAVSERWFSLVALVAVSNTSLFAMVAASRLLYGMASEGSIPRLFARVLPGRGTPLPASVAVAATVAALASTGAVDELAGAAVTLLLSVLVAVNTAAWRTRPVPEAAAAFRSPAWVAPTGAIASGTLLVHQLVTSSAEDVARLAALLAAVVVLWAANRLSRSGGVGSDDADPA